MMCKMECQRSLTGVIFLIIGFGVIGGKAGNRCSEPDNFRCVDYRQWPDYYCGQRWVKKNCGRMCGTCNIIDEAEETDIVAIVEVEEVIKPIQAGCDVSDSFHCYEYFHEKEYYCGQAWLKENCRYMCGICGCDEIDNFRCALYQEAKEHYCRQLWVMQNCKYLCGSCGIIEEVGETLTIEREKRVLKVTNNSTVNATSDESKTETQKKLDDSNTQKTTADDNEDAKVVTDNDDGRTNNKVDDLNKKNSKKYSEKVIQDEEDTKSKQKEEQKKTLKSIISAVKGKKKIESVKEDKSETMKKDIHRKNNDKVEKIMNGKEDTKSKQKEEQKKTLKSIISAVKGNKKIISVKEDKLETMKKEIHLSNNDKLEKIMKGKEDTKSNEKEEQKKTLKSIISAVKGKKKIKSVKDDKSETMKKEIHLNNNDKVEKIMKDKEDTKSNEKEEQKNTLKSIISAVKGKKKIKSVKDDKSQTMKKEIHLNNNDNVDKIMKDKEDTKSNEKEEQKKTLKSIISAVKGKKKIKSVKEDKSETMKKEIHLNNKVDKIMKDEKDTKSNEKDEQKKTLHDNKNTNTNVAINVDVEMQNGEKEKKKIVKERTGEDNDKQTLIKEIQRKKNMLFDGIVDIEKKKQSKSSLDTNLAKNVTTKDKKTAIVNNVDKNEETGTTMKVVNDMTNERKMIKDTNAKITVEVTISKERKDDDTQDTQDKGKNDGKVKVKQVINPDQDETSRDQMKTSKPMINAERVDSEQAKGVENGNDTYITKKELGMKNEDGEQKKDNEKMIKEVKVIDKKIKKTEGEKGKLKMDSVRKDKSMKMDSMRPPSVGTLKEKPTRKVIDAIKKVKNMKTDNDDGIKETIMKGQDIIDTGIREIEEIWNTPSNKPTKVEQFYVDLAVARKNRTIGKTNEKVAETNVSTKEKEYTRRRNEKVTEEEVSPIVKMNQNTVNLQISEMKPDKIIWDGNDENPKGQPDCKKLDNFRCFFLTKGKNGLCELSWFQQHCKYMCGICDSKTLDGASYENKLRIPVL